MVGCVIVPVAHPAGVARRLNQQFLSAVKALPKGTRPDPISYPEKSEIDAHLAKFDKGGSYLVPKDVLDRFGRNLLGYLDNSQFIITMEQMDAMLRALIGIFLWWKRSWASLPELGMEGK